MEHRDGIHPRPAGAHPSGAEAVGYDRSWAGEVRSAGRCAGALFALLLCVDRAGGSLTWGRAALWLLLALLLLLVLFPVRVSAGPGWLASRRLLRTRRVRTDLLAAVSPLDGVTRRLVLHDTLGNRVEIDPEVLVRNPELWYRFDEGARASEAAGTLLCGTAALHRLARRVDRETARDVFRASGLE
ncbi:hypothetical protein ACIP4Y_10890 [Streptomyces sp. NPDC088810]|uniref:hypothetical protein n=1 Tax=unclassified Streptomyces TaxID=2593676 RepID=UPI00381A3E27